MGQLSEQFAGLLERTRCADGGALNMHVAIFVTVVAIMVGFAVPTCANDRPSDPFGNHTIELNKEAPLVEMWESLRDQVLLDKAHFHSCIESNNESNNTDCAAVSTLMKIVEEARQNQGKALLGHINRSINLLINAAPGADGCFGLQGCPSLSFGVLDDRLRASIFDAMNRLMPTTWSGHFA